MSVVSEEWKCTINLNVDDNFAGSALVQPD